MSNELRRYHSLGRIEDFSFLLRNILSKKWKKIKDIQSFCLSSTERIRMPVQGALAFLLFIKVLDKKDNKLKISKENLQLKDKAEDFDELKKEIIIRFLKKIENKEFEDFISRENIQYDSNSYNYYIKNTQIPLKYSNIKQLLIHLDFLIVDEKDSNKLIFDKKIEQLMKSHVKKKITPEKLREINENKRIAGEIAEKYVMRFEKKRLSNHPQKNHIEQVSLIDVTAGFDIISFESEEEPERRRFIEVKSYSSKEEFFWSKGEIEMAKKKRERYYIYLIDKSKIDEEDYTPNIIKNPYDVVIEGDNWLTECEKIKARGINL